uniref:Uncharacterized protein n=1 Tax=Oryza glaberrima TaxID=4538 RepID=I1PTF6_ORYGL
MAAAGRSLFPRECQAGAVWEFDKTRVPRQLGSLALHRSSLSLSSTGEETGGRGRLAEEVVEW